MSVSLNTIVDVNVEVSNPTTISSDFNLGCIIGSSTILTSDNRVKLYHKSTFMTEMVSDGFTTDSAEYLGAVAYFSQNPTPETLAVGVKLQSETDAEAITATRAINEEIYVFSFAYETTDTNIPAVASAVDAFSSPTLFLYQTKDAKCLQSGSTNILKTIKDTDTNKTCGFYSTQKNLINAVMGLICGLNSMDSNSAYTLAYKSLIGFTPEEINDVQLQNLVGYNGNTYCQFGRRYNFIYHGLMAGGYHVDEQFLIDSARYLIQQYAVAGLTSARVVPQTESGVTSVISFITRACEVLRRAGFIATGIWTGGDVLNLTAGDSVNNGYYIQSESIADQNPEDRKARKSPTIYVALKAAGAIEHIVVRAFINQ